MKLKLIIRKLIIIPYDYYFNEESVDCVISTNILLNDIIDKLKSK